MDFSPGSIITFSYNGTKVNDKKPIVVVLGQHKDKLHAININYLNVLQERRLRQAFAYSFLTRVLKTENPAKTIASDPIKFYNNYVKKFMRILKSNVYRTYKINDISNVKIKESIIE